MASQVNKKLKVTLETEHLEAVSYLEGYLRGVHDIGWIRMHPNRFRDKDKYEWLVEVKNQRFAYSTMNVEGIGYDLGQSLELCLSDYKINHKWKHPRDYKISVQEMDANVEF